MLLSAFRIFLFLLSLLAISHPVLAAGQDAPKRVVSLNLCTDQLAMLLARPGQLISVSHLAADETLSLMSTEANQLMINHGLAEEIFRMDPDLVLAGKYTTRATVNLLRRLGKPVEEFDPASSFGDIAANTMRLGRLLGNREAAERLIARMWTEVSALSRDPAQSRPVLGSFGTNSYTSGAGTLENDVVGKAGFRHLGDDIGITGTTRLPLEALVLANPDYLMIWDRHRTSRSRSAAVLTHPALDARFGEERRISADTRYWILRYPPYRRGYQALARKRSIESRPEDESGTPFFPSFWEASHWRWRFCSSLSLGLGQVWIAPGLLIKSWGHPGTAEAVILAEIRLPRALLALFVGAILGLSGAVLQGFCAIRSQNRDCSEYRPRPRLARFWRSMAG